MRHMHRRREQRHALLAEQARIGNWLLGRRPDGIWNWIRHMEDSIPRSFLSCSRPTGLGSRENMECGGTRVSRMVRSGIWTALVRCAPTLGLIFALSCAAPSVRNDPESGDMAVAAAEQERLLEEVNRIAHVIEDRVREAREQGNMLTELEALRSLDSEEQASSEMIRNVLALKLSELSATIGNYGDAIRYADRDDSTEPVVVDPVPVEALGRALPVALPVRAIEAIRELASSRRVIMINEAHHDPRHRAFTMQLLEAMYDEGFRYFAAETLNEADTALAERGYPTAESGFYIVEPVYGSLVRTAIRLGYTVIPYESTNDLTADEREREQAANLQSRILKADPQAKVIVHAGWGHIFEAPVEGVVPMAVRFRELTGIDPFTIDQTIMRERARPELEHPLLRSALEEGRIEGPTIFVRDGHPLSLAPESVDATLFHPRASLSRGRPTWLSIGGRRVAHSVPTALVPSGVHALVRAWPVDEPSEAIPIDQVEVTSTGPRPALLLEAGTYRVEAQTAAGDLLGVTQMKVP